MSILSHVSGRVFYSFECTYLIADKVAMYLQYSLFVFKLMGFIPQYGTHLSLFICIGPCVSGSFNAFRVVSELH